jgi:hypothetical protein
VSVREKTMSDMLFTAGIDDADFNRALGRMEGSAGRTSQGVDRMFKLFAGGALANRVAGAISSTLEAAAANSAEAAQNLAAFKDSWNGLKADIGMDLQPFLKDATAAEGWLAGLRKGVVNTTSDAFSEWGRILGMGTGGEGEGADAIDTERKRAMEQEKAERRRNTIADERLKMTEAEARARGDDYGASIAAENKLHEMEKKRIGGIGGNEGADLRAREDARHLAALGQIENKNDLAIAAAERTKELHAEDLRAMLEQLDISNRMIDTEDRAATLDQVRLDFEEKRNKLRRDESLSTAETNSGISRLDDLERDALMRTGRKFDRDQAEKQKYSLLDAGSVGNARTRAQVLGGSGFAGGALSGQQEQIEAVKKTAMSAEEQVRLLRSIDRGIQKDRAGVFQ